MGLTKMGAATVGPLAPRKALACLSKACALRASRLDLEQHACKRTTLEPCIECMLIKLALILNKGQQGTGTPRLSRGPNELRDREITGKANHHNGFPWRIGWCESGHLNLPTRIVPLKVCQGTPREARKEGLRSLEGPSPKCPCGSWGLPTLLAKECKKGKKGKGGLGGARKGTRRKVALNLVIAT